MPASRGPTIGASYHFENINISFAIYVNDSHGLQIGALAIGETMILENTFVLTLNMRKRLALTTVSLLKRNVFCNKINAWHQNVKKYPTF